MSTQRNSYPPDFKARVAFEAMKGQKTINQIAGEYGVHPSQISTWKKQLQDGLPQVFTVKARQQRQGEDEEALKARLYQQIGQLQVELDWLKKKAERAGILLGSLTGGR